MDAKEYCQTRERHYLNELVSGQYRLKMWDAGSWCIYNDETKQYMCSDGLCWTYDAMHHLVWKGDKESGITKLYILKKW